MLKITGLKKKFGSYAALNGLDMEIGSGELYGFVGPNGAGKTTTMKIVSGLLRADQGEILVDDVDIMGNRRKLKEKIGYMPDFFGVYDNLKAIEYLEFYASIYGITGAGARRLCNELMEMVRLSDKCDDYVDSLSRGMKQRLCLARCLVHDPALLILDEPTAGLDPRARLEMKEIFIRLKNRGKTILISSHILSELSELCTAVGIIDKGKMIVSGTVGKITTALKTTNPLIIKILDGQENAVRIMKNNPLVDKISIGQDFLSIGLAGGDNEVAALLHTLVLNQVSVASFYREEGSLEELFMRITGNKNEEELDG